VKHQDGPWLFALALDAGYASLETTRNINLVGVTSAHSRPSLWRVDARARAAYLAEFGSVYVKPTLDVDFIYSLMPAFAESGAGALNLHVARASSVALAASPMIEIGQTIAWENGAAMRPYVQGGATLMTDNSMTLSSTLEGAPTGTAPLATVSAGPRVLARAGAGLDLFAIAGIANLDLRLQYEARFGDGYQDQTGVAKLSRRF
jgi:uncharacterized protein with beta-barrel porin domain